MAEALALGRAFDEPGDVGEHELVLVEAHHAEVRHERGERIVGDLRLGRAHHRDQRRLARVREADERGVGEQLQLELQPPLFAVLPLLGERRRAAGVRQEARVAAPADAALRRHPAVAVAARGRRATRRPGPARPCRLGTSMTRSAPAEPCFFLPDPCVPDFALRCGWSRNASSDGTLRVARSQMSPPLPPSPPSGPPFGTCDSRRNATTPAPPLPACTFNCATSTNSDIHRKSTGAAVRSPA